MHTILHFRLSLGYQKKKKKKWEKKVIFLFCMKFYHFVSSMGFIFRFVYSKVFYLFIFVCLAVAFSFFLYYFAVFFFFFLLDIHIYFAAKYFEFFMELTRAVATIKNTTKTTTNLSCKKFIFLVTFSYCSW